tara:strand:+ start:217 stop:546 length:330 start_codon:yes stop_codon:yes gene_type:complete
MEKDPSLEKSYPQWIVNKALSNFTDSILWANEMNLRWQLDKRLQYDFYINILRPRRRFSPWTKKESIEYLEDIKEYYGYSYTKSLAVLRILSKDDLEKIRKLLHKGGIG